MKTQEIIIEQFQGGSEWIRGGGGNILPQNTVLEEVIVDPQGLIKWSGIIYTGLLRINDAGGWKANLVDYARDEHGGIKLEWRDNVYYRRTGIARMQEDEA